MSLYWVDLFILVVIGLSVLTGLIRGFIKELIALIIWILAFWLAFHYFESFAPLLQKYIQDKTSRSIAAFIIILLITLIAGAIVNGLLSFILRRSGLSGTDRLLGMVFGFVRGVFIIALMITAVKMTSLPYNDYARQSKLYSQFDPIVNWLYNLIPEFIKERDFFPKQKKQNQPKLPEKGAQSLAAPYDFEFNEEA